MPKKKSNGYWRDFENLRRELCELMQAQGWEYLPSVTGLDRAGRHDLYHAIRLHGGAEQVAQRLGLETRPFRRPAGYWTQARLLAELAALMQQYRLDHFPTRNELRAFHRSDLLEPVRCHGGTYRLSPLLGLPANATHPQGRPKGYWSRDKLLAELRAFIQERGLEHFPTQMMLKQAGRVDLVNQIYRHGGMFVVAELVGVPSNSKNRRRERA